MARFEMTITTGEKILVDHAAGDMSAILSELNGHGFMLFSEVKGGSSTPAREVIVASTKITLIRLLGEGRSQGSDFRPKR